MRPVFRPALCPAFRSVQRVKVPLRSSNVPLLPVDQVEIYGYVMDFSLFATSASLAFRGVLTGQFARTSFRL
jgi:hypothetical protein